METESKERFIDSCLARKTPGFLSKIRLPSTTKSIQIPEPIPGVSTVWPCSTTRSTTSIHMMMIACCVLCQRVQKIRKHTSNIRSICVPPVVSGYSWKFSCLKCLHAIFGHVRLLRVITAAKTGDISNTPPLGSKGTYINKCENTSSKYLLVFVLLFRAYR